MNASVRGKDLNGGKRRRRPNRVMAWMIGATLLLPATASMTVLLRAAGEAAQARRLEAVARQDLEERQAQAERQTRAELSVLREAIEDDLTPRVIRHDQATRTTRHETTTARPPRARPEPQPTATSTATATATVTTTASPSPLACVDELICVNHPVSRPGSASSATGGATALLLATFGFTLYRRR